MEEFSTHNPNNLARHSAVTPPYQCIRGKKYLHELLLKLVREDTLGAKAFGDERHRLLGLGVEGGVHDQTVDEDPQMVLHL
jgi:hypothetical protein